MSEPPTRWHWHVSTMPGEACPLALWDLAEALDYAASELATDINYAREQAHAFGEQGAYEAGFRRFIDAERWETLQLNLRNAHRQLTAPQDERAPLYAMAPTLTESDALARKHAVWVAADVCQTGPAGFCVWECAMPWCAPAMTITDDNENGE